MFVNDIALFIPFFLCGPTGLYVLLFLYDRAVLSVEFCRFRKFWNNDVITTILVGLFGRRTKKWFVCTTDRLLAVDVKVCADFSSSLALFFLRFYFFISGIRVLRIIVGIFPRFSIDGKFIALRTG